MQYINLVISITALINILIVLIVFFSKERLKTFETNTYGGILIINAINVFIEIISFFVLQKLGYESSIYLLLMKTILCCYLAWVQLFFVYVLTISKGEELNTKKTTLASIIIYAIFAIIIFISPMEYVIKDGLYIPSGIATGIVYGFSGICDLLMVYLFIRYGMKSLRKKYIPMIALIISSCLVVTFQMFNPEYFLMTAMLVYTTIIMYFTIENPDVKMIEQLGIAKSQAEKANAAKTEFLSSMSHEIRTPLNAIVGFSDYIINSTTLEEAKENAEDIVNASQTLLEIVNGILDISKIEAGKLEIINTKYTARKTFEGLAKLITPKMQEKGLDFSYYIAPDIPETLFGDHANIKKVITNLLSNAYKYTDKGFVRYEVNCVNSDEYTKLIITVEDSGRGIKQESVDKLFTKFQRLDEDRNTTIEGTGLGLAITKQLIELMGGKILVHTVYGEGSKFTVVLNQRIEAVPVKEEVQISTTELNLKDKRILIIDDSLLNIKVATKILERYNANNIKSYDNGFSCIDDIKQGNVYDLILMDDMMQKMTGVETFKKLKELPGFNMPVVILTANAITGMKEKYLNEGFDDYLAKPIEKEELIRVCNTIFSKYQNITSNVDSSKVEIETIEELENKEELEKNEVIAADEITKKEEIVEVIDPIANLELIEPVTEENINDLRDNSKSDEVIDPISELELVEPVEEIELVEPIEKNTESELENYLKENNVDLDKALEFLGDMEMYNATVGDFLSEIKAKWNRIIEYKNNNDMPNYAIEVHSLKSDAKYLGLMTLADIAYEHELKSKENNSEFVNDNFKRLEVECTKALNIMKTYHRKIN